jgi:hypothetical protein
MYGFRARARSYWLHSAHLVCACLRLRPMRNEGYLGITRNGLFRLSSIKTMRLCLYSYNPRVRVSYIDTLGPVAYCPVYAISDVEHFVGRGAKICQDSEGVADAIC